MKDRNQYKEIEDFLDDNSFRLWMTTKTDNNGWEEWTLENPQRAKLVEEARLWILAMKVPENNLPLDQIDAALQNTWMKIEQKEQKQEQNTIPKIIKIWNTNTLSRVAAILIFGLLSFYAYNKYFITEKEHYDNHQVVVKCNEEGLLEQINNSNKPQIINLSDGSSVLLQPKSKLSYPKIFTGNQRNAYLSGEAFFEISKNPKKPFFVHTDEIVTKVVGTSFRIKAYDNQANLEILVRTGKVKVNSENNVAQKEIVLLPNQALRYIHKNHSFDKITDITTDNSIRSTVRSIDQLSFDFDDIPITQILKTIEQAYSVDIDYPKENLRNCHLTTSLGDQPLPEKLKIICKSLGNNSSYTMNGNQITILSNGCN